MNEKPQPMGVDELIREIAPNEDDSVRFTSNIESIKFKSRDEAIKHIAKIVTNGLIIGNTYQTGEESRVVGYTISQDGNKFHINNADFPYY